MSQSKGPSDPFRISGGAPSAGGGPGGEAWYNAVMEITLQGLRPQLDKHCPLPMRQLITAEAAAGVVGAVRARVCVRGGRVWMAG